MTDLTEQMRDLRNSACAAEEQRDDLESELAATKTELTEAQAAQLAIAEAFGLAHHQSMGPAYPAPWSKLLPVVLAAAKAQNELADAERERDVGYDALDVLMEREDRAKTELARERDDARAELTTTKAKLAEVVQERDDAAKSAEYLAKRYNATSAELERERRVVAAVNAILEKGPRYTDRHLEAAADAVVDEIREAMALASATSSQPASAGKEDAGKTADFDPPGREYTVGDALGLRRDR